RGAIDAHATFLFEEEPIRSCPGSGNANCNASPSLWSEGHGAMCRWLSESTERDTVSRDRRSCLTSWGLSCPTTKLYSLSTSAKMLSLSRSLLEQFAECRPNLPRIKRKRAV